MRNALGEANVSSDFYDALDAEVQNLLDDAERRVEENSRNTVQLRNH